MLFKRRFRLLAVLLLLAFTIGVIYLAHLYNRQNDEDYFDYPDFHEKDVKEITTERDFIDPNIHVFLDQEDEAGPLTEHTPEMRRKKKGSNLNVYHGVEHSVNQTSCVPFKTLNGSTPICIYSREEDEMISSYIKDYGTWEPDLLNLTAEILLANSNLNFIDIGCNIGAFTLFIAKLGRKVIALDALKYNLDLLHESLTLGKLHDNVTLILNALSDTNQDVMVKVVRGNIGGSYIKDVEPSVENHNLEQQSLADTMVKAIVFDDLIELFEPSKEIFIKMDIEGNEWKALKQASKFFQSFNVRYLLMEWMLHRRNLSGKNIYDFLLRNGMLPYNVQNRKEILPRNFASWPDNVLWIKR